MSAAGQSGRVYKFGRKLTFYAMEGAIRTHLIVDATPEKPEHEVIKDLDPRVFLKRAASIYLEIPRCRLRGEMAELRKMGSEVEDACKEAMRMGSPFEPTEAEIKQSKAFAEEMARVVKARNYADIRMGNIIIPQGVQI